MSDSTLPGQILQLLIYRATTVKGNFNLSSESILVIKQKGVLYQNMFAISP